MNFTIAMDKGDLVKRIIENKEAHIEQFDAALDEWFKQVEKANVGLIEALADADDNDEENAESIRKAIQKLNRLSIGVPKNMVDTYESAIAMISAHEGVAVTLTQEDFKHLVEDEWSWKRTWFENVSHYTSR